MDPRFNAAHTLQHVMAEQMTEERERAINQVASSVTELAEIFKEIQVLVIEGCAILDRIDVVHRASGCRVLLRRLKRAPQGERVRKRREVVCDARGTAGPRPVGFCGTQRPRSDLSALFRIGSQEEEQDDAVPYLLLRSRRDGDRSSPQEDVARLLSGASGLVTKDDETQTVSSGLTPRRLSTVEARCRRRHAGPPAWTTSRSACGSPSPPTRTTNLCRWAARRRRRRR